MNLLSKDLKSEVCLNRSESYIAELVGQGMTNIQISKRLFLSIGTIKVYVHRLYGRLNMDRGSGARIRLILAVKRSRYE